MYSRWEARHVKKVDFHPVWEEKVEPAERERIIAFADTKSIVPDALTTELYRGKYKKNGAIVATVLIGNGYTAERHVTGVTVRVFSQAGDLLAVEDFTLNLRIAAGAFQVWSFVFKPEPMRLVERKTEADWRIELVENVKK